jgi:hypothetical protein
MRATRSVDFGRRLVAEVAWKDGIAEPDHFYVGKVAFARGHNGTWYSMPAFIRSTP